MLRSFSFGVVGRSSVSSGVILGFLGDVQSPAAGSLSVVPGGSVGCSIILRGPRGVVNRNLYLVKAWSRVILRFGVVDWGSIVVVLYSTLTG